MFENEKTKERGRLLAIIAVMAMVFAGAAVTMSAAESEAAPVNPVLVEMEVPEDAVDVSKNDYKIDAEGAYFASGDCTVTVGFVEEAILYVLDGKKVTLKGTDSNEGLVVVAMYSVKDGAKYTVGSGTAPDTIVIVDKIQSADSVSVTGSIGAKGTIGDKGKSSTIKVGGKATSDTAGIRSETLVDNTVTVDKSLEVLEGAEGITAAYATSASDIVTFYENVPKNVSFTSTGEDDWVAFYEDANDRITAKINITTDKGTTTFSMTDSGIPNDLIILAIKSNYPVLHQGDGTVITLEKGYALIHYETETPEIFEYTGQINGVAEVDNEALLAPQLLYVKAADTTGALAFVNVQGTVTQKSSVTIPAGLESGVYVDEGQTLIIAEGVTVTNNSESEISGEVELYGALIMKGAEGWFGSDAVLKIGPVGYTNYDVGDAIKSNVSSIGVQPAIGSTVYQDERLGDVIIAAPKTGDTGLTILEGATLTIYGDLGLNDQTVRVDGTLHVTSTGSLYSTIFSASMDSDSKIIIGPTGKVIIDGQMGINTVIAFATGATEFRIGGIVGFEFDLVDDGAGGTTFSIGGELSENPLKHPESRSSIVFVGPAFVDKPLVIGEDVVFALDEDPITVRSPGSIEVNGAFAAYSDEGVILTSGTFAAINGIVMGFFSAYQGPITDTEKGTTPNTAATFLAGIRAVGESPDVKYYYNYYAGAVIGVTQVKEGKNIEQRVLIQGDVTLVKSNTESPRKVVAPTSMAITTTLASGRLYVAEEQKLTISEDGDFPIGSSANVLTVVAEGDIEKATTPLKTADGSDCPYIGGHYIIKTTGTGAKTTHYYEPLAQAIGMIDLADGKVVDASVEKIDFDMTILGKQTLNMVRDDTVIADDATVTFENGAVQTGSAVAEVQGVLIQRNGAKVLEPLKYSSEITNPDGDVIWTGLQATVDNAQPGDTIEIVGGKTDGNLVIDKDLTVRITGPVEIGGNLELGEKDKLIIESGGELIFFGGKAHSIDNAGLLDSKDGGISKATADDKLNLTVTGETVIASESAMDVFDSFSGASYESADGIVLTTLDKAIPGAIKAAIDFVVKIHGNVVHADALTVEKVTIVFKDANAVLNAGEIVLIDATIDVSTGSFTGTVRASLMMGNSTAAFTAAKGISIVSEKDALTLSGAISSGDIAIQFGTVYLDGFTMSGSAVLVVEERTTVSAKGTATVNGGRFAVIGTAEAVNGGRLVLNAGEILIHGTLIAAKGETSGTVEINRAKVLGTIENKGGEFRLSGDPSETTGLIIGDEPGNLGAANGTVIGDITADGNAILIYAGADFDGMTIDGIEVGKLKMTVFHINDVPYMYLVSSSSVGITDAMLGTPKYNLPGYDVPSNIKTLAGWNLPASATTGNPAFANFELKKHPYPVMVSPIKGMSIIIDGITYSSNREAELFFGEHSISYRMDPGYKVKDGTEIVLSFNGVAVKDKFTITPGIDESDLKVTAVGSIVIDQDIPEQQKQDDSIIIIMLAILVVMVVILAIVTILRMMRS